MSHPHDLVAMLENMGCTFSFVYPPVPWRGDDWQCYNEEWWADFDSGGPLSIGNGKTKEACALQVLDSAMVSEYLERAHES